MFRLNHAVVGVFVACTLVGLVPAMIIVGLASLFWWPAHPWPLVEVWAISLTVGVIGTMYLLRLARRREQ